MQALVSENTFDHEAADVRFFYGSKDTGLAQYARVWVESAHDLVFGTNDTERGRLLSTGEFGLGMSPTAMFSVGDMSTAAVTSKSSGVARILLKNKQTTWNDETGIAIDFECNYTSDPVARIAAFQANGSSSGTTRDYTEIGFFVNADSTNNSYAALTEKMRITPVGVGFGTGGPTTLLTIKKPIDASAYGAGTRMIDFMSYYPGYDEDNVKASIYAGVSDKGTLNTNAGYLSFLVSDDTETLNEWVRIEKNGYTGFGTSDPDEQVTVYRSSAEDNELKIKNTYNGNYQPILRLEKTRGSDTGYVAAGNELGQIIFSGYDSGGTPARRTGAKIEVEVSSNAAANYETSLKFFTSDGSSDKTTEDMIINELGRVGIARTPSSHRIEVSGTAGLTTGTTWTNISDERVKKNITEYRKGLEEVKAMRFKEFDYNGEAFTQKGLHSIGIIAQELEMILPECVVDLNDKLRDGSRAKGFNPHPLWSVYGNAIKELARENEILRDRVSQLEELVA